MASTGRPRHGPFHHSLVAAGGRLLHSRSECHPPAHRTECPFLLDERDPARGRSVPGHASRVRSGAPGRLWAGALVATLSENLVGVMTVSTAISLAEGRSMLDRLPQMLKIGVIVSITNASLALMGLTVLWTNPASVWLFVVPIGTAAIAYRSYIAQRQQHERIELLYESTRILQRNPRLEGAITALLEHLRRMFRADIAEICLIPRHEGEEVLRSRIGPGDATELMHPIGPFLDDPLLVQAIAERRARLIDPSSGDPEGAEGTTRRSLLVAPLLGESTLV